MTIIKKAPLMAFVLGLGLLTTMVTMNSFKGEKLAPVLYGKDATQPTGWRNLSGITQDNLPPFTPNSYRCTVNDASICTGVFDSTTPPTSGSSVPTGPIVNGNFIFTP